jgi:hypothetical protein
MVEVLCKVFADIYSEKENDFYIQQYACSYPLFVVNQISKTVGRGFLISLSNISLPTPNNPFFISYPLLSRTGICGGCSNRCTYRRFFSFNVLI